MPAPTLNAYWQAMPMVGVQVGLHKKKGDENDLEFNRGCPQCNDKAEQRIVCEKCGLTNISAKECVKIYREKGHDPIVFTADEVEVAKGAKEKKARCDVEAYIPASEFDPLWVRDCWEMTPDENGAQTYAYVRAAMKAKNVVGIGTMTLYGKKRRFAVVPNGKWLLLYALEFQSTVRSSEKLCADADGYTPNDADLVPEAIDGAVAKLEELPERAEYRNGQNITQENLLKAIEDRRRDPKSAVIPLTVEIPKETRPDAVSFFMAAAAKKREKAA